MNKKVVAHCNEGRSGNMMMIFLLINDNVRDLYEQ